MTAQIITASPIPFTEGGEVDRPAFTAALEAIDPHVYGALIAGTTGEFPALEDQERIDLFRLAAEVLGLDRVVAHLGHGSTRQVLRLAEGTRALGITRFALLTPYYLPTDGYGVVEFFRALTSAHPDASVYAYLFPERTGMEIPVPVLQEVMALPGMRGVKLSGGAAGRLAEYATVLRPGQELFSGNDATLPEVMRAGGDGVVSGVSAAFPETFAALARAIDARTQEEIDALQATVLELVELTGPTIPRLKSAMAERSGAPWAVRMSLPAVDVHTEESIREAVRDHR